MSVCCEYLRLMHSVCPPGKVSCAICNKRCRGTVLKIEDHYLHKLCFRCHNVLYPAVTEFVRELLLQSVERPWTKRISNFVTNVSTVLRTIGRNIPSNVLHVAILWKVKLSQHWEVPFILFAFAASLARPKPTEGAKIGLCRLPLPPRFVSLLTYTNLHETGNFPQSYCTVLSKSTWDGRTIPSGEKIMALNNRFYCEKCVPPQIARGGSTGVEEATSNPPQKWTSSSSSTPPPQDLSVNPREKSPPKVKIPKSSSLPRRLGGLFRFKKSHSQTLQPTTPSTRVEESTSKNTTLTNGTDALTVNVGEADMASTDSGIGKKFDHSQSPTYSLYSGDETVLAKQQDLQTTPIESYPVTHSTSGNPAMPYSLDAALTTPSMVNTLSVDASTLLFGSVRRICPPGVDYGHQYPVSYLRLAEQGYTAVTSSDLLSSTSPLSATATPVSIRRPPPSASASSTQRLSRRDMPSTHHAQTRTLPISSADPTSRQVGGFVDHRYNAQVFGGVDGARPEKDRYARYRQLSPAGISMGRALSSGRSVGAPPNFIACKSRIGRPFELRGVKKVFHSATMHQCTRGIMLGFSCQEAFRTSISIVLVIREAKHPAVAVQLFIVVVFVVKPDLHLSIFFRLLETYSSYSTPNVNCRRGKWHFIVAFYDGCGTSDEVHSAKQPLGGVAFSLSWSLFFLAIFTVTSLSSGVSSLSTSKELNPALLMFSYSRSGAKLISNLSFLLAETMMRSPPRLGRSVSPEAALLAQTEARRLAAYPGAKIPDADSEPAIDRYDWPAPPSPAVVMIDRRECDISLISDR
ncbi:unnamed protein product [Taenia asiatica]|uniref:LIM zinc-binding domain-containing protein n=1 Tax=Taenia asiatica TaxID=60517 RepID=A0A0R3VW88_TAEAS|nr:unnamed protein product [Taenia asiatica]